MANTNQVFAALTDPTRRAVFERLRYGPRPVGEIARGLPVSRPAVSQHLKVLKEAGWEPPARLVLIWQLTPEFAYDPDLITEVEVLFSPDGAGTHVDLEHRDLERLGDKADAMRETVSGPGGWPALLQLFADEAQN